MKNKQLIYSLIVALFFLVILLINQRFSSREPQFLVPPSPPPVFIEPRPQRRRQPEFRQPPLRNYKPQSFQQVGLLTSDGGDTLPLYGKESAAYNNRWNYYTTTQGDQIYSVPVTHNNRDCTEDIGCEELFDNQNVSVFGQDGTNYQTKLYRIDQHPYSLEF